MHAPTRWCRGRADVQPLYRCGVRYQSQRGPCDVLAQVLDPAGDIAADVIRVILLESRRCHDMSRQDAVTKARGKALDLGLDASCHVVCRRMGHVAIGPGGVFVSWGACGIE